MPRPLVTSAARQPAEAVAAQYADVYLLWGEPPHGSPSASRRCARSPPSSGRALRFGIRLHVIARERRGRRLGRGAAPARLMPQEQIEIAQKRFARQESVGQQRMVALHNGKLDSEALTVAPNLWAGIGLVRGGAGTALVGSYDEVADRIREYAALGLDTFILSGYPHLEEAYTVGEEILPASAMTASVPAARRRLARFPRASSTCAAGRPAAAPARRRPRSRGADRTARCVPSASPGSSASAARPPAPAPAASAPRRRPDPAAPARRPNTARYQCSGGTASLWSFSSVFIAHHAPESPEADLERHGHHARAKQPRRTHAGLTLG